MSPAGGRHNEICPGAPPSGSAGQRLRCQRRTKVWFLFSFSCLVKINYFDIVSASSYGAASTTSNNATTPEEFSIKLCGRVLKCTPSAHGAQYPYGVYRWNRSFNSAIVIPNKTGWPHVYGRAGNQIQIFFRAFDMARDRGGALVLHESGFPVDLTLRRLFLGINFAELEHLFGVTFYSKLDEQQRSKLAVVPTDEAYYYISNDTRFTLFDIIDHRHYLIRELYRISAREMITSANSAAVTDMCSSMHAFFGKNGNSQMSRSAIEALNMSNPISRKYVVLHSRGLEKRGSEFLAKAHQRFGVDRRAAFDFPPHMIQSILAPLGMTNNSIVMISDGQNQEVIEKLSTAFGRRFQVVPSTMSTLTGDLMLAILSEVFIGNPVSTFSQYIVQVRYALGIGNSYLFTRKNTGTEQWETFCNDEECFYHWLNIWVPLFPNPYKKK